MGARRCSGDHDYTTTDLGAGLRRMECKACGATIVDLAANGSGRAVSVPGLFRPSGPTLFTVLAEERRAMESSREPEAESADGPRYAFSPSGSRSAAR